MRVMCATRSSPIGSNKLPPSRNCASKAVGIVGTSSSTTMRSNGAWAGQPVTPEGKLIDRAEYEKRIGEWIPTAEDKAYVMSLMQRVAEPGKMASWVAPPDRGINNLPVDYEYVHLQ